MKSALLTCKKKSVNLLARGAEIAIAAESPPPEYVERYGAAAQHLQPRDQLLAVAGGGGPAARRGPTSACSTCTPPTTRCTCGRPIATNRRSTCARLDELIGEAAEAAPDAAFFFTADHGMNYKKRCWDLDKALGARGSPVKFALSAEKDRYVKHHRTFGGTAYVWLNSPEDAPEVRERILQLEGIEAVRTREEAARDFDLMPERIGELVVTGDRDTVFGELAGDFEALEASYRSHGSLHESDVPLVVYNWKGVLPSLTAFGRNADLLHFVLR